MVRKLSAHDRFFAKVNKTDTCWNWTAKKVHNGYGQFWIEGRYIVAHRVAYEWFVGSIPTGMEIDHTCHNRGCVNATHMRLVTHKQNQENKAGAYRNSNSGLRGVRRAGRGEGWIAEVTHNGVTRKYGTYDTPELAAEVARLKRLELFTHNDLDRVA